jgi:hypothetical protein
MDEHIPHLIISILNKLKEQSVTPLSISFKEYIKRICTFKQKLKTMYLKKDNCSEGLSIAIIRQIDKVSE